MASMQRPCAHVENDVRLAASRGWTLTSLRTLPVQASARARENKRPKNPAQPTPIEPIPVQANISQYK